MNCPNCGKEITEKRIKDGKDRKYCSAKCFFEHRDISGSKNPMYGRHHSEESKKRIIARQPDMSGENAYWYGRKLSEEHKKKLSIAKLKTEEEKVHYIYTCAYCGKEFVHKRKKVKKYCSERCMRLGSRKRKRCLICDQPLEKRGVSRKECKPKCLICGKECNHHYDKYCSVKCRAEAQRIYHLQRVQKLYANNQKLQPFYSKKACQWFIDFDKDNNTNGQHAETKKGERLVKGYWLDYVNDDMKLIIEWNESQHYKKDGSLKVKDIRKKKEVMEEYPEYEYWMIKESTMTTDKYNPAR